MVLYMLSSRSILAFEVMLLWLDSLCLYLRQTPITLCCAPNCSPDASLPGAPAKLGAMQGLECLLHVARRFKKNLTSPVSLSTMLTRLQDFTDTIKTNGHFHHLRRCNDLSSLQKSHCQDLALQARKGPTCTFTWQCQCSGITESLFR